MTIMLNKFGQVLTSRPSGKEAYSAFLPTLAGIGKDEDVIVDFDGIITFSPSWGDEFLTPLVKTYGKRLSMQNTTNPSVELTLETLEGIHGYKFRVA